MAKRGEVFLVTLDPTVGAEMQKTRPAVVVSPDELNLSLSTVIVVPLTTGRSYPFRPQTRVGGKPGVAAVDQVRTIDKRRLSRRIGVLSEGALTSVLGSLAELFAV
jgi:mRNA interferase MazF